MHEVQVSRTDVLVEGRATTAEDCGGPGHADEVHGGLRADLGHVCAIGAHWRTLEEAGAATAF